MNKKGMRKIIAFGIAVIALLITAILSIIITEDLSPNYWTAMMVAMSFYFGANYGEHWTDMKKSIGNSGKKSAG